MIKKIYLSIFLFFSCFQIAHVQSFLTVDFLEHYTPEDLVGFSFNLLSFDQGCDAYKVTYETTDLDGNVVIVSGLLALPEDLTRKYPLACYQHGTSGTKENVPSRLELDARIALSLAGQGYITVAPDLLGLGDHEGVHPYVHADSEAWVAVDMMRALREYATNENILMNDQVFITGYSQGGHSAMALHRHLEENLSDEFSVTATAPMSGPYSIAEVMYDLIISEEEYTKPAYLINTFISYQAVYGNVYSDISSTFKEPYQAFVEDFSNHVISLNQLDSALSAELTNNEGTVIPLKVLKDDYVEEVKSNPDHPMLVAMQENNVYDWSPAAPTRLLYCTADEEVPFENSITAQAAMIDNGAADVEAIDINPQLTHFFCALPAALEMSEFFAQYQNIEDPSVSSSEVIENGLAISPNPAKDFVNIGNITEAGQILVIDVNGKDWLKQTLIPGDNLLWLTNLPSGIYVLKLISNNNIRSQKLMLR